MPPIPPQDSGEDPESGQALAAGRGLVPVPRAAGRGHPHRASRTGEGTVWPTTVTVALTPEEGRALRQFCAQASSDVGPPAVDSSEVLRALLGAMRRSEALGGWVRDALARSRSGPEPESGRAQGGSATSVELSSNDPSAPRHAPALVVLSRRGRHRAPPRD